VTVDVQLSVLSTCTIRAVSAAK